jgi:hypothetical protein
MVFERFKRFEDGLEDLQDDPVSGRPPAPRNADIIANVRELVTRDHRWALRMMTDELNMNKETIYQMLHEDLRKRRICAKFVPHKLTSCQDFIQTYQNNPNFNTYIVFLDFIHRPVFYLNTAFRRLNSVSVFRWILPMWAQSIELDPISRHQHRHKRGYINQAQHKPSARVKVKRSYTHEA